MSWGSIQCLTFNHQHIHQIDKTDLKLQNWTKDALVLIVLTCIPCNTCITCITCITVFTENLKKYHLLTYSVTTWKQEMLAHLKTFPNILLNMASNTQIIVNVRGFVLNNNTKSSIDFHQLFQSVFSTWYIIMTNQTLQHETCKHANMKHANQRSHLPCKVLIGTVKSRQYLFIILLFFF